MNPKKRDVSSSVSVYENENMIEFDMARFPKSERYLRVLDEIGNCIGSVDRDVLTYVERTRTLERLTSMLDVIDEGITAIDEDGRIYYVNPAYTKLLGVPAGKVLGRYLQQVEPSAAMLDILAYPHKPVIQRKRLIQTINKYVSMQAYPVFLHGKFRGAVSVFTDITRLNELNQEVERISQMAEEYSRQLEAETVLKQSKVIGQSKVYVNSIMKTITVARTDVAVLLRGESGSGKEVFARILRANSPRKNAPFVTVNCSAIPETLIESELFGYEEGAFTGAKRGGSIGKFQMAQGGTIFLDEIGDMPMLMQAKLLRVLQEGEIEKIGRQKNIPVDVRIIAATNQPLEDMIQENRFRQDLYYRLNVVSITIPPLRARENDVLLLADYFLSVCNEKYQKNLHFSSEVYQKFLNYSWPGNVRELQNAIESIAVLSQDGSVRLSDLPEHIACAGQTTLPQAEIVAPCLEYVPQGTLAENVAAYERDLLAYTLKCCEGNRNEAIARLGLSRRTFYRKLSQYQLK